MICGIDVGTSGSIFVLDPDQPTSGEAFDIPVHLLIRGKSQKREIDIQGLLALLLPGFIEHAFVEQVGAMPGQGVSSMFAFGKSYGIILGVLSAREIPFTLVHPTVWKRALGLSKDKDASRARASQLLPKAAHQFRLKKDHGKAEACLLALYGLRQLAK